MVRWESATDPLVHACRVTVTDVPTTGGTEVGRITPQNPPPTCDIYNVACQLEIQIRAALEGFFGIARDVWTDAIGGLRALALTKDLLGRFSHQALSVEEAAKASAAPRLTDECRQGLQAFLEKKPAPWGAKP